MKNWKPSDIIILALVFIVFTVITAVISAKIFDGNTIPTENLDLIIGFAGMIVTGSLMYVTKNNKD